MKSSGQTQNTRTVAVAQRASAENASQAGLSYPAVPVLQQNNTSSAGTPVLQAAGWTHAELMTKINAEMPEGICNALTAAYIAGVLQTNSADNTTGVDDNNWEVIKSLKRLLDAAIASLNDEDVESKNVSFAFSSYLDEKGAPWLLALPTKNTDAEAAAFDRWYRASVIDEAGAAELPEHDCGGLYADITTDMISGMIENALEGGFSLGTNFDGIVVLKFVKPPIHRGHPHLPAGGHQFAIKHTSSAGYNNNTFSIFDQNTGIHTHVIQSDDDITDKLTAHLFDSYVTERVHGTSGMMLSATINFAEDDD
jgi:hypothetical protein